MNDFKYFLDTNIFLRIIHKDGGTDKVVACQAILQQVIEGKLQCVASTLVLAEIVWTCLRYYKFSKSDVVEILHSLTSLQHLSLEQDYDMLLAIEYYERYTLKYIDACLAAHSCFKDKNVIMVSYDRDFDVLPIKRLEPSQIL